MSSHLRRNLKRTGLAVLAILALLLLLAIGTAGWLLGTSGGGRWLFSQVPGLAVTGFEGRLAQQWSADTLQWESDTIQVSVQQPSMSWSPGCLWDRELCLHRLQVAAVDLQIAPAEEETASAEPITLPEIKLPLAIRIDQLSIGRLTFNDTLVLQDLDLAAQLNGSELRIERLNLGREDLQLQVDGTVTMTEAWPIDAHIDLRMPLVDDQLHVALDARGRVGRNLHLDAKIDGYVAGTLSGMVQPLEPGVPVELTVKPTRLPIPETVPATLHPQDLELYAVGNLEDGWSVEAKARLPAEGEPMPLALTGHVSTDSARIDALTINGAGEGGLGVEGSLNWSDALAAEASLSWRSFPWTRLLPEVAPPPVSLQTLDAQVSYADEAYEGQLDANFTGPAGPSSLSTPFQGDLGSIRLPALSLTAGPGSINGSVAVDFAEALGWQTELRVEDLNPGYWLADLPGALAGTIQSQGQLTEAGPELTANVDLSGQLRDRPAQIRVAATADGGAWQAEPLLVSLGDNRITGTAAQRETLSADLAIELQQLDQLWPGLAGALTGSVSASGYPDKLQASVNLDGTGLSFADNSLETLEINGQVDGETLTLDSALRGIEVAGQRIDQVRLDADGTLANHQLHIRAEEARGSLDLTFDGGSETIQSPLADETPGETPGEATASIPTDGSAAVWGGQLSAGAIEIADQTWRLQSPAPLAYRENGVATLGAHCWAWEDASLCTEDQRLWPEPRIRVRLEDLPGRLTDQFLPPDVRWRASVNADIELDIDEQGPRGQVLVDAGPGQFNVLEPLSEDESEGEPEWIEYPYDILRITADLTPEQLVAGVQLAGPKLGTFQLEATVDDPNSDTRPLSGSFTLEDLDLAIARPFAQLEEFAGTLNGRGTLGGTLTEPTVTGQIRLTDGQIADEKLPMQFEDLGVLVQFTETGAELEGNWRSGEDGRGNIEGVASWAGEPKASIRITGERLFARVEPFAEVEVAPDLTVNYANDQLSIVGEVAIPRGAVEIRELPPQAVTVSDDAVIVGEQAEGEEAPEPEGSSPVANLSLQLDIIVGEDQLTFDGFGVTGELEGRLRIGDNLDTRGELSLVDGQYEIYGQQLQLRKANLLFAGPISQPFLEIEAVRQVGDVTAGIRLTGPADEPITEVFSEPPMAEEQALSYLILGRPLQSEQDNSVVGTAALSIGLNQVAPLTRAIGEQVGVQDLQLDTEGSGDQQRITASGYLTDKLSIRYGVSLFDTANKLALRYDLTKQLYLEAASGVASSLDIFYSRDFW